MKLKNKNVAILVEQDYQDLEVWYPLLRLKEEGANVFTVGTNNIKMYKGKYGYPVKVNMDIKKAKKKKFDAVVIPGGWAPDFLRRYKNIVEFVRDMHKSGKIVASICHGASLLVSAGILKGKRITCFFAVKDDVVSAGAKFIDREVVVDKNIITSRKPDDLPSFCKAIIKKLQDG